MKYNKGRADGEMQTYKPTMDADFMELVPLRVMLPKGWKRGACHNCFFKALGSRCAKMLKTFCPLKEAR